VSVSVYAGRATIGERYVTKKGWPIIIREIGDKVVVENDLTGETHRIGRDQLVWPYKESLISKEAITMARAKGHKKHAAKKAKKAAAPAAAAPTIKAGVKLNRVYNGKPHIVEALQDGGYLYNGENLASLTAVAKKITGYASISGPAFFKKAEQTEAAAA
jgi:hypothetical protein